MAYGSPASLSDVEHYYTDIRGGRRPSAGELQALIDRYKAIGGSSPLLSITRSQAAKLQDLLRSRNSRTSVYTGMRHSPPFIADVISEASDDGVDELLSIALAPHYSRIGIGGYMAAVRAAVGSLRRSMRLEFINSWHDERWLIETWRNNIAAVAGKLPPDRWMIFTAHSLPARIIEEGDPYKAQLLETAGLIAEKCNTARWSFSFQSASHTGEPWLGPELIAHLNSLSENGEKDLLIAPIGFVSDHLEILYDIDVDAGGWARRNGVRLIRAPLPNDSQSFIECLYQLVSKNGFL